MRNPETIVAELADLDAVLDAFGDPTSLQDYPGALLTHESLARRRQQLVSELADAEMATLAVVLEGRDVVGKGDVDVDFLVSALGPLQDAVSSVGQALEMRPTGRSSIPVAIREATALRLVGTFPGSFGLALAGPRAEEGALFDLVALGSGDERPIFERAVEQVLDVLETSASHDVERADADLLQTLAGLGSRAYGHLRRLAAAVSSTNTRMLLVFNRLQAETRLVTLAKPGADRLQRVLTDTKFDEREVKMQGRLVGASLVRDNFELERSDGTIVRGKVDPEVVDDLRSFFSNECVVTLRVSRAQSAVDEVEVENYTLVRIA